MVSAPPALAVREPLGAATARVQPRLCGRGSGVVLRLLSAAGPEDLWGAGP